MKRHAAMVFFAYVLLQLGSGFDRIMGSIRANLRTIGSRCRLAGTEVLCSLVRFVVKMAHKDLDPRRIMDLVTKPLDRSGYWHQNSLPNSSVTYNSYSSVTSCHAAFSGACLVVPIWIWRKPWARLALIRY